MSKAGNPNQAFYREKLARTISAYLFLLYPYLHFALRSLHGYLVIGDSISC
jgi:hypothetical protein